MRSRRMTVTERALLKERVWYNGDVIRKDVFMNIRGNKNVRLAVIVVLIIIAVALFLMIEPA